MKIFIGICVCDSAHFDEKPVPFTQVSQVCWEHWKSGLDSFCRHNRAGSVEFVHNEEKANSLTKADKGQNHEIIPNNRPTILKDSLRVEQSGGRARCLKQAIWGCCWRLVLRTEPLRGLYWRQHGVQGPVQLSTGRNYISEWLECSRVAQERATVV